MSIFNFFKRSEPQSLFSGGNGDSFETAVVINAEDTFSGIDAEHEYLDRRFGKRQIDYQINKQALHERGAEAYDIFTITLSTGEVKTCYFNISKFFGK